MQQGARACSAYPMLAVFYLYLRYAPTARPMMAITTERAFNFLPFDAATAAGAAAAAGGTASAFGAFAARAFGLAFGAGLGLRVRVVFFGEVPPAFGDMVDLPHARARNWAPGQHGVEGRRVDDRSREKSFFG